MTKKERALYKSGKSNKNSYHFSIIRESQRKKVAYIIIVMIIASVLLLLHISGIASLDEMKSTFGAIDGVQPIESDFAVYYLDVGQSDCTIVICDGEVLMIDTGSLRRINTIRQSMHTLNIHSIDYMVITHQHDDHMGSASELINDVPVENFIMPKLAESNNITDNKTYNILINTLADKDINRIPSQECESFMLGDALVEILSPTVQSNNINNMSIVLKITYGETEFLFQSDAETKIENDLIRSDYDIDVDVLKIGHHGSKTSSSEKFLNVTSPEFAIISSGARNTYSHPNKKILDRLEEFEIYTFVTSLDGDIAVSSDGNTIKVHTQYSSDIFEYNKC